MKGYKRLTREQRYQIYALLKKERHHRTVMARDPAVDNSTASRELKRDRGRRASRPRRADE